jgi:hypothetical protein
MSTIVIMPGGFHPFHAGHLALYNSAQKAFPGAEVFVAATNDTSSRPFPFAVKEKLAKLAGVEPGHFVQVKSPFRAEEITGQFDPKKDRLIFVRSEKDAGKPPQAGGNKKDGSPAYLQPLAGQTNIAPFAQHAYMAYLPTVEFGPGMTSATEIRSAWPALNEKRKTALVMSLYPKTQTNPKLAQTVVKLLDAAIGGEPGVTEGLLESINVMQPKNIVAVAQQAFARLYPGVKLYGKSVPEGVGLTTNKGQEGIASAFAGSDRERGAFYLTLNAYAEDDSMLVVIEDATAGEYKGAATAIIKALFEAGERQYKTQQRLFVVNDNANYDAWSIIANRVGAELVESADQGVEEGNLNEFAPGDDGDSGQEDLFFKYAKLWYNGNLAVQQRIEQTLAQAGWEIGELESEEGGAFIVRSGDEHGDTYMGWPAEELTDVSENQGWAATFTNETNAQNFVGGMKASYQARENQPVQDYLEERGGV